MALFSNEGEMQRWLSKQLADDTAVCELIANYELFKEEQLPKYTPLVIKKVRESFLYCLASFENNTLISENSDISLNPKDKLKPDFLLYAPETESIVVIELKNQKGATREAGTEIGAYAAEIKTYLPYISDGEVVSVIVATEWPALLRHFVFNEVFWMQRNLICLEPVNTDEGVRLQIVDPAIFAESDINTKINARQLGGYQLCLYDDELYKGGDYYRTAAYENQMRAALNAMVAKGNALKTHGFAFLWRHCFHIGLAPYNITIINIAPFQSLPKPIKGSDLNLTNISNKLLNIRQEYAPEGHGQALESIREYGSQFLTTFCDPKPEGFMQWRDLQPNIFYQTDAIAFVGWDIFGELFFDRLAQEYREDNFEWAQDSPLLANRMIEELMY